MRPNDVGHFGRVAQWMLATACLIALVGAPAAGVEAAGFPRKNHSWARFGKGAWKLARVSTETLNERGEVTETTLTETKTTLEDVSDKGVTLRIQVALEVGGKRIETEPQIVQQSFAGEPAEAVSQSKVLGPGQVEIDGRTYSCQIYQIETTIDGKRTLTKLYYCDAVAPYALKTETTFVEAADETRTGRTNIEVVALDMPYRLFSRLRRTAHLRSTCQSLKGKTITFAVEAADVPGGVVFQTSKELDASDRLVRRSTLELVDYGVPSEDDADADRDSFRSAEGGTD